MSLDTRVGIVPPHIAQACAPTEKMHPIQKMARETITNCLPTLHYYYKEEKCNPHAPKAEEFAIKWFNDYLSTNTEADKRFIKGVQINRFAQFAAHCSPAASEFDSAIAATLAVWLFHSDDIIEVNDDVEGMADQFQRVKEVCDDPKKVDPASKSSLRALADIVARMHTVCTDALKPRFTASVDKYLQSNLWERNNIEEKRTPPVEEYLEMRYHTSATPLSFHMVELEKRLNIPDGIYEDADVKELLRSGAFCCNNQNEIVSYFKEWQQAQAQGDAVIHNLVAVFMAEDTRTDVSDDMKLKKAFDRTAEALKTELHTFYAMREKVKARDFGPYTAQVAQLADGIADWISAHHFWSVYAPRYGGPGFAAN